MVPQIARRHFLALPLGLLLVPRPSVAATSTRKDFTFRVDVGVLFDLLTFTVAGALVEEVDVQAGRYRVAFSGEGSGITNRTEATGIIRAGRFMPVETKSTGTVRGRENRVDVRYDYERGRVEYHSVGHTLLLGRRRQVDDVPLCANDSETRTSPGITVEGGARCLSHGNPEEAEWSPAAGPCRHGGA